MDKKNRVRTDNQLKNDEKLRTKFLRLQAYENEKKAIQIYEETVMLNNLEKNNIIYDITKVTIMQDPIYKESEINKIDKFSVPAPPIKLGRVRSRKTYYPYDIIENK